MAGVIETDCYLHLKSLLYSITATVMTTLTMPLPKRTPVSMLMSVALHGAVIAGILYASFQQVSEVPKASQPISVTMVAPDVQPEPARPLYSHLHLNPNLSLNRSPSPRPSRRKQSRYRFPNLNLSQNRNQNRNLSTSGSSQNVR